MRPCGLVVIVTALQLQLIVNIYYRNDNILLTFFFAPLPITFLPFTLTQPNKLHTELHFIFFLSFLKQQEHNEVDRLFLILA